jgi:N utilization substance protein A
MNGQEMLRVIDSLQRDRGIDKNIIYEGIETAMANAARRHFLLEREDEIAVTIDRLTGEITADFEGDHIDVEELGRIAAQTAKQVIIQKLREAEREVVYEDFGKRVGELVNGTVQRVEAKIIVVNLGRTEGILPRSEQAMGEFYRPGERIRCLIKDVVNENNRIKIVLSRKSPEFVRNLFELEVPEISERIIEIKGLEREAGFRCKVAVFSVDSRVDAVGACVGVRGSRIRTIVDELNGEKIDIIRWSDKAEVFLANSLKPAEIAQTNLFYEEKRAELVVDDDQLSLAIGKRGQNVRLASTLTGWEIDVVSWTQLRERSLMGQNELEGIPGIDGDMLETMRLQGISSLKSIKLRGLEALHQLGMSEQRAEEVMDYAYEFIPPKLPPRELSPRPTLTVEALRADADVTKSEKTSE